MKPLPVCLCVHCEVDRDNERAQYLLRGDSWKAPASYFNPNTGGPTWVTKAMAPRVGPHHADRARGLQQELVPGTSEAAGWYEIEGLAVRSEP